MRFPILPEERDQHCGSAEPGSLDGTAGTVGKLPADKVGQVGHAPPFDSPGNPPVVSIWARRLIPRIGERPVGAGAWAVSPIYPQDVDIRGRNSEAGKEYVQRPARERSV